MNIKIEDLYRITLEVINNNQDRFAIEDKGLNHLYGLAFNDGVLRLFDRLLLAWSEDVEKSINKENKDEY